MAKSKDPSPVNIGWAGGVNLLLDPRAIPDNQIANGKNCWPTVEGLLAKREAVAFERVAIKNAVSLIHPIAMFVPDPSTGFDFVVHYADNAGLEWLVAGAFSDSLRADCPTVQVAKGSPMGYQPMSMVNYRGAVIAVGAGNEGFYQLTQAANKSWAWHHVSFDWTGYDPAATQSQVQPVKPQVVGVYRERLYFANFGVGMGNWMVAADRDTAWAYNATPDDDHRDNVPLWSQVGPDVLAFNGFHIEINKLAGQTIQAIDEVSTQSTSNALQTAFLVRTKTNGILATGEISETTGQGNQASYVGDWSPAAINVQCGCAGPYASCRTPNGLFWASGEDVFALYDGMPSPTRIGTSIRPALRACPQNLQKLWHMAYADGVVYLSVATQNSTDELTPAVQHWRLDLRPTGDGDEMSRPQGAADARWWGPQDYEHLAGLSTSGFATMSCAIASRRGQSDQDTLYGMILMDGSNDGAVEQLFLHLVSYNQTYKGYDAPYREVLTGRTWTPSDPNSPPGNVVAVGDIVRGTPLNYDGYLYIYTVGGAVGVTEPVWPGPGVAFADGAAMLQELVSATNDTANHMSYRTPTFVPTDSDAQRIAMEPNFKELDFGTNLLDKIFLRADIAAFFSVKQQVWMDVLANGGDLKMHMGPAVLGDFTIGRVPAYNDLGLTTLDLSSLAKNFQARTMRPNDSTRDRNIAVNPGIVRGRSLQPCLREGSGFVIDDGNDYVVVCQSDEGGMNVTLIKQAQVVHGYYDTYNDLMVAVLAALNAAIIGTEITSFTANDPFADATPYIPAIITNVSENVPPNQASAHIIFRFDPTDIGASVGGVKYYVGRCQRLMATLGFDTSETYSAAWAAAAPGVVTEFPFDGGVKGWVIGPQGIVTGGNSPTRHTYAVQAVPYVNSAEVAVTDLKGTFGLKAGRPIGLGDRQS